MIRKYRNYFIRNRYSLSVFILLNLACAVCIGLVFARVAYSDSGRHLGLIWNLFLAWIPFILAYFAYLVSWRRATLYLIIPVIAFLWLIFFPNAPYILTDLQHLAGNWRDVPVWYDVMLLVWFSFTGLMLGMTSLFMMQEIIRREFGRWTGWGFVGIVTILSSTGVYVGRFLRWNSWDIFRDFSGMAQLTLARVQDPSLQSIGFTSLFGAFFLFLYVTLYAFGHLLLERQKNEASALPTSTGTIVSGGS